MRGDGLIHSEDGLVVNAIVTFVVLGTNDTGVYFGHEVLQQRHASLGVQITPILGSVGNDFVHLIKLLSRDGVGNERRFVQRFVVGTFRLHANLHHLLKRQFHTSLDHGHHKDCIVEVLLLLDLHATSRRLLKASLGSLLSPLQQVGIIVVPILHHGIGEDSRDNVILMLCVERLHDLL
eukprot:Skav227594  [mRNA]  locus=scaffold1141:233892:237028:- [translate_table: standard]